MIRVLVEFTNGETACYDPVFDGEKRTDPSLTLKDGAIVVGYGHGYDIFPLHNVREAWRRELGCSQGQY